MITRAGAEVVDEDGKAVERVVRETEMSGALIGKGNYDHFMQK